MKNTSETILFSKLTPEHDEIMVTNHYLTIPVEGEQKKFLMADIQSVRVEKSSLKTTILRILVALVFGGLFLFFLANKLNNVFFIFLGLISLISAGVIFYLNRPKYFVYISTMGIFFPTYGSYDKKIVEDIATAIFRVIIDK